MEGLPMTTPDSKKWFDDSWRRVRAQLRVEMESRHFDYWIAPLHILSASPELIEVACRSEFMRDRTVEKFGQRVTDLIAARLPKLGRVDFVVDPAPKKPPVLRVAKIAATGNDGEAAILPVEAAAADIAPVSSVSEPRLLVEDIKRTVAAHYAITVGELESASRKREHVRPRQMAMHVARVLTRRSFPDLAKRFGDRDHTTIIHGCRKMAAQIASDPVLAAEFEAVMRQCQH
jgi:chromosomal replication initiation ATPase DnaA